MKIEIYFMLFTDAVNSLSLYMQLLNKSITCLFSGS